MKLTDNEKMKNTYSKFNEETKVWVPVGKKCVLKNKEDVEEDTKSDSRSTKLESDAKEESENKSSDGSEKKVMKTQIKKLKKRKWWYG